MLCTVSLFLLHFCQLLYWPFRLSLRISPVFCLPDLPVERARKKFFCDLGRIAPVFRHCHRHVRDSRRPGSDGSGQHPVQREQIPHLLPAEYRQGAHDSGPAGRHASGGGKHGRQSGACLQGGTAKSVLRHCQCISHVPVPDGKGSAASGQDLRRGAAAVLQCQLYHPAASTISGTASTLPT